MFNWLFGVGDEVVTDDGEKHKVKGFSSEGYVNLRNTRTGKDTSRFGGNVSKQSDQGNKKEGGGK